MFGSRTRIRVALFKSWSSKSHELQEEFIGEPHEAYKNMQYLVTTMGVQTYPDGRGSKTKQHAKDMCLLAMVMCGYSPDYKLVWLKDDYYIHVTKVDV